MKKSMIFTALAAAAIAFSCNKPEEVSTPGLVHFRLTAGVPQTKTSLMDMGGGEYQPLWQEGDELGILFSAEAPASSKDLKPNAVFKAELDDSDGMTATFVGDAAVDDNEEQTIYAFYPASSVKKFYSNGSIGLDILAEQHPVFVNSNYSFDPASDLLVSKPHTCLVVDGEAVTNENMVFTRVSSVVKFNFNASNGDKAYLQHVKSVTLATASANISGRVAVSPVTGEVTAVNQMTNSKAVVLLPTEDCHAMVGANGGNCLFASVAPVTVKANEVVTITVVTDDYTITKTLETHPEFSFPVGQIFVFNLNITDAECVENGGSEGGDEGGDDADLSHTDVITSADLAAENTTYTTFSNVVKTVGTYAGNTAKSTDGFIQFRSKNSESGIVSTSGEGVVKSVTVDFTDDNTNTLSVYGSNTAYLAASDLYATSGNTNQGKLIGELSSDGTVTFTGDYQYVGIRSKSGAVYVESIKIVWGEASEASVPVASVSLDKASATLEVGKSVTLTATVSPDNATNKSVTWASDHEDVATVENGVVTAVAAGTATITVTTVDGAKTATCAVTVNAEQVVETTIADALTKVGDEKTYQITGVVSNITNNTYGNFDLVDGASSIYIYGLLTADGQSKQFSSMGIAEGDTLTVKGKVITYNNKVEIEAATFVSLSKKSDQSDEGGDSTNSEHTIVFADVASANSWENGVAQTDFTVDGVHFVVSGGGNNGKYYTSDATFRMYNGGGLTLSVAGGTITEVSSNPSQTFTIENGVASISFSATVKFKSITVKY